MVGVLRDKFGRGGCQLYFAREKMAKLSNVVAPTESLNVISYDEPDNRILECARAADSECIVSEDKDLLRLKAFEGIAIVRASEFLEQTPGR